MAKARAKHRSQSMTIPVAVIAGFAPMASYVLSRYQSGGASGALSGLCVATTGFDTTSGHFDWKLLASNSGPVVLGILAHKLAGRLGVNRALANAGVPFLRF